MDYQKYKDRALQLLLQGLSKEEVSNRLFKTFLDDDLFTENAGARAQAHIIVTEVKEELDYVYDDTKGTVLEDVFQRVDRYVNPKGRDVYEVPKDQQIVLTYEDIEKVSKFKQFLQLKPKGQPSEFKNITTTNPVTGDLKTYNLVWDSKLKNYVDADNLGPIYSFDEKQLFPEIVNPDGSVGVDTTVLREYLAGNMTKAEYEAMFKPKLVDHLDKYKATFGMFKADAGLDGEGLGGAIDETRSGKLFIPDSTSEFGTMLGAGGSTNFIEREEARKIAEAERKRIANALASKIPKPSIGGPPGTVKENRDERYFNFENSGVTQDEYKRRINKGMVFDKYFGWMDPNIDKNKEAVKEEIKKNPELNDKVKPELKKDDDTTTPPAGGQPPAGQDSDTKAKTGEVKKQSDIKSTPSFTPSAVTELPGLTGQRAAEMGTSPAQVAAGLPALLPGGTSPFARASYGGILGNLASAFKLVGTAMPSLFSTADLAGMYGAADDPKAFAKFISQKPEVLKAQIADALKKLEEVKEIAMKDQYSPALLSGSIGDLYTGFVQNPEIELKTRMSIAGFGKPKWLRDSIDQAYLDKYNQARLTNPLGITQPGFYSDTFADKPDLVNQDNSVSGNDKSNTLGNNTGSTSEQVQQYELTKRFTATNVVQSGTNEVESGMMATAAPTDTTDSMTALKTAMSGSGGGPASLALGGMSQANPEVGAGMMGGQPLSSARLTPSPQDATAIGGGTFIDPTTYNDPRFRPETYIAQGMSVDAATAMANQAFQNFTNQQRLDQGLVQRTDAEGNLLPFFDRPPVTGEVSQSFTPTSGGTEIGMGAPPVGDPIDVVNVAGNIAKAGMRAAMPLGTAAMQLGKGVVSGMKSIGLPPYTIPTGAPQNERDTYDILPPPMPAQSPTTTTQQLATAPGVPFPLGTIGPRVRVTARKRAEDELDELLAMMGGSYDGGRGAM